MTRRQLTHLLSPRRLFVVGVIATALTTVSCSKSPPPPGAPVPDLTVGPGLTVTLDTSDFILVSVTTVKGSHATPTHAGRLQPGSGTNPAGDKPEGADVRLRFAVAPPMSTRGEAPVWFASAADRKISELTQRDAAEFLYTGGQVSLTVSSDGASVVITQK